MLEISKMEIITVGKIWIHKDGRIEQGTYRDGKLINRYDE